MEEEFYAVVKLVSGEEIFAIVSPTEEHGIQYLIISHPIKVTKQELNQDYSGYKIEPWLRMTSETLFVLEKSRIITVVESFDEEMIQLYKKYLNKGFSGTSGNYILNKEEGYINNVKQARMILEKLYRIK